MSKEWATDFYRSAAWNRARHIALERAHYTCSMCGCAGTLIVHHKTHLTEDNIKDLEIALGQDNLSVLCIPCHNWLHYSQDRCSFDAAGNIDKCKDDNSDLLDRLQHMDIPPIPEP